MEANSPELKRLFEVYDAFVEESRECIPRVLRLGGLLPAELGVPGMRDRYVGREGIADLCHVSTDPWEWIRIETGRTLVRSTDVVAQSACTVTDGRAVWRARASRPATWCAPRTQDRRVPGVSPWEDTLAELTALPDIVMPNEDVPHRY